MTDLAVPNEGFPMVSRHSTTSTTLAAQRQSGGAIVPARCSSAVTVTRCFLGVALVGVITASCSLIGDSGNAAFEVSRVIHDEQVFGVDDRHSPGSANTNMGAVTVATDGRTLIAVGSASGALFGIPGTHSQVTQSETHEPYGAVWRSSDGERWVLNRDVGERAGERRYFTTVAASDSRVVAAGYQEHVGENHVRGPAGNLVNAIMWYSDDDGVTWQDATPSTRPDGTMIHSVSARPDGGFVAVGTVVTERSRSSVALVFVSADGQSWEQVAHDPNVFGNGADVTVLRDVISDGTQFIAVGESGSTFGFWSSDDASAWTVQRDAQHQGSGSVNAVTVGGPGYVAAGTFCPATADDSERQSGKCFRGAIWTSSDGTTWSRSAYGGNAFGSGSFILTLAAADNGHVVAAGRDDGDPGFWSSPDGAVWLRLPVNDPNTGAERTYPSASSVAPTSAGLIAVGGGGTAANAWTLASTDG